MAISRPVTIGQNAEAFAAGTITLTTTATVPPGAKVFGFVGWGFSTATLSSASDNAALPLTWRVDRQIANGNIHFGLIEADAPQGLPSGTIITATFSAATPDAREMSGAYATGVKAGASFNGNSDITGSTGWTSGSLSPLPGRLFIGGCYGGNTASPTSTPGGTNVEIHDFANAGFSSMSTGSHISLSAAPQSVNGTWSVTAGGNASVGSVFLPAEDGWAPARPRLLSLSRMGWQRFPRLGFPLPDIPFPAVAGDVTVVAGAATALGVTPAPVVQVDSLGPSAINTAAVALGVTPAPVVNITRPVTAGLALGVTPAPTPLVVVFPTAALGLGVTPAPTVVIGAADVTVTPGAAIALGVTPAPLVLVTVPIAPGIALGVTPAPGKLATVVSTAALALGITPAPVKLVVVFPTAALALGVTPTATAVIGSSNVTVTPSAVLALGSTPAPVVLVSVSKTAALALGVTPPATPGKSVVVVASLALGVAPTAAVRVLVTLSPALALGVAPAPTTITVPADALTFLPSLRSVFRGRLQSETSGGVAIVGPDPRMPQAADKGGYMPSSALSGRLRVTYD